MYVFRPINVLFLEDNYFSHSQYSLIVYSFVGLEPLELIDMLSLFSLLMRFSRFGFSDIVEDSLTANFLILRLF